MTAALELLTQAARRGVDTRVLTASGKSDLRSTWFAGRARYQQLLEAGVRIYEYQPTMMHTKTFVVDGVWSMFGSANFDNRSFRLNFEVTCLVSDAGLCKEVESMTEAVQNIEPAHLFFLL